jgi:hypothetical protein
MIDHSNSLLVYPGNTFDVFGKNLFITSLLTYS